jgi:hypothetical protein
VFISSSNIKDFTITGNIGDTIGGITAPVVGLLGTILVYFALLAQIDANKQIQFQIALQQKSDYENKVVAYLNSQLEIIRFDINDYKFIESTKTNPLIAVYEGSEAIYRYLKLYKKYQEKGDDELFIDVYPLEQLRLLLEHIDNFLLSIETENLSEEDKKYLVRNISYQYKSKIKLHLDYFNDYDKTLNSIFSIAKSINSRLKI